MSHSRRLALIAGLLYLLTHATSVLAVVAYGGALTDPAAVDPTAVRTGAMLEFLLAIGCLGTGTALLPLLRPHSEALAATFALLRTMEAAVIAVGALPMLALSSLGPDAAGPLGAALVDLHAGAFLIGQGLIIAVNTPVLAWMLLRARLVPAPLAVLGLVGGVVVFASNVAQLFAIIPAGGAVAGLCAVPIFTFELWFAAYLVFRGLRETDAVPAAGSAARAG